MSVIIITRNRKPEVLECLESVIRQSHRPIEIVVVDNDSEVELFEACKGKISQACQPVNFKYLKQKENKGVAGGRNIGIENSNGEILVFIDDDAVFVTNDALEKVVASFATEKSLGALAFKSLNYFTARVDPNEFPHCNKLRNPDKPFETTYFIGVGHAIRKDVFAKTGLYPEDFFYSMEEYDLSYRILDNGYKILYDPLVCVHHRVSDSGRVESKAKRSRKAENKMKLAIRNLPFINVVSVCVLWSGKYLLESGGDIRGLLKIYRNLFASMRKLLTDRNVITSKTIRKIKKLGGYLYY